MRRRLSLRFRVKEYCLIIIRITSDSSVRLETKPAYEAMEETDLLIMVGTSFPYREFLPDGVEAIQLDSDATQIGRRYPVSIGLVGDSKTTLSQLTHNLDYQENRRFLEECQVNMENWWKHVEKEENEVSTPIKPQQVIPKLQKIVDDDAIVSVDVGNGDGMDGETFPHDESKICDFKLAGNDGLRTSGCDCRKACPS